MVGVTYLSLPLSLKAQLIFNLTLNEKKSLSLVIPVIGRHPLIPFAPGTHGAGPQSHPTLQPDKNTNDSAPPNPLWGTREGPLSGPGLGTG